MLNASAKILLNPSINTTLGDSDPPVAPATMAKAVSIPSSPPKIMGLSNPPSDWCCSSDVGGSVSRSSWYFLVCLFVRDGVFLVL